MTDVNSDTTQRSNSPDTTQSRQGPDEQRMQGHWLLAKLGKRVLRPGGIGLTRRILSAAAPSAGDRIVEFGPGVGRTASILLEAGPTSYVAVDPNPQGRGPLQEVLSSYPQARLVVADAAATGLPDGQTDLLVAEAMLTMHSDADKAAIVAEGARLLAPGGRYAVHELLRVATTPTEHVEPGSRDPVAKELSRTIKVGARPLTLEGWRDLFAAQGLEVVWMGQAPMHLLEPRRIIADEGLAGAIRFGVNLLRNKAARQRILAMRRSFRDNAASLAAIGMVARRPLS